MNTKVKMVYAIVDVMVWDMQTPGPANFGDYTGVRHDTITNPYVPGREGARLIGVDVNKGIGGCDVAIYALYKWVNLYDPEVEVVTSVEVMHWPHWVPAFPTGSVARDGWCLASGSVADIQGALNPKTKGDCWRIGLVMRKKPITETEYFLTNLFLCITNTAAPVHPPYAHANGGLWPMESCMLDIHCYCGDNRAFYVCYARCKSAAAIPKNIADDEKLALMRKHAPFVYMHSQEKYLPSTVEFSFRYLNRKLIEGKYWLQTKEELDSPSSVLPYFGGDMENAKAYAFWVNKEPFGICEITYFFYYPYNRGKEVMNTIWGNHVGDWEHATVRLAWELKGDKWVLTPYEVYLSAHSGGNVRRWSDISKNNSSPVIYSAKGSHAMYFAAGSYVYKDIVIIKLTDHCDQGPVFNTAQANKIAAFDFETQKGLDGSPWPSWMSSDFTTAGTNPSDPSSGGIYRWGNTQQGCDFGFGQCRLENGPTGPISKSDVWNPDILEGQ